MKLTLSTAFTLLAAPVFAHGGAHLHPHGAEGPVFLMLGLAIIAAAVVAIRRR